MLYANKRAAQLLQDELSSGFKILCSTPAPQREVQNLILALYHGYRNIVKGCLIRAHEGSILTDPYSGLAYFPTGVCPQKGANKLRLLHHLSHHKGKLVSDGFRGNRPK